MTAELPEELVESAVELWESLGLTRPWNDPRADLRRALGAPASTVLADLDSGCELATVMVGHDGHRGWVYYLAVRPELQGVGRGREMMREAERWLRQAGVPKLNLMVRAGNVPAKGFYIRIGYSPSDDAHLDRSPRSSSANATQRCYVVSALDRRWVYAAEPEALGCRLDDLCTRSSGLSAPCATSAAELRRGSVTAGWLGGSGVPVARAAGFRPRLQVVPDALGDDVGGVVVGGGVSGARHELASDVRDRGREVIE